MTPRQTTSRLIALVISLVLGGSSAQAAQVVVVCPIKFRESLKPWVNHRLDDGVSVTIVNTAANSEALIELVRAAAKNDTKYVLLIGDAPVIGTQCDTSRQVPVCYLPTTVTAKWHSTATLATDLPLGDFDDDEIPDAAVGRLPVQRPAELNQLIQRIIAYETSNDFGDWRGQVQLVGGIGGFGAMADAAIESVTRTVVTSVLPAETKTSVAYASPGHKFFPEGDSFTDAIVDRYAHGARFWVYAGHGQVTALDRVPNTKDGVPVLDHNSLMRLKRPATSAPIALMLACYTGAIDAADDSLSERMLLFDGGPIAVLSGSRVTMPYGNTTAAVGLIRGVYEERQPRLGDAWLSALQQMHNDNPADKTPTRMMIDALATIVSPAGTQLVDERREHMQLYNLLGDPTLRMHHPEAAVIEVASGFNVGEAISISVQCPIQGDLTVSIERPLGVTTSSLDDPNDTVIASMTQSVRAGTTAKSQFKISSKITGPMVVRAFVSGDNNWATGAGKTIIRAPSSIGAPSSNSASTSTITPDAR